MEKKLTIYKVELCTGVGESNIERKNLIRDFRTILVCCAF